MDINLENYMKQGEPEQRERGYIWHTAIGLQKADYNNLKLGIHATQKYLDRFFANLLLGEKFELKNRDLLVTGAKDDTVNDTVNDTVKITVTQQKVLNALKENADLTALQIAERMGVSEATVKRALSALKTAGLIKRVGSDKTGHWDVKG